MIGALRPDPFFAVSGSSPAFRARQAVGSAAVALALLLVLNPEVRIALLFVDAIGLELVLLLVVYQLRLAVGRLSHVGATLSYLCSGRPLPFCIPTLRQLKSDPAYAACALVWPFAALSVAFGTGP